MPAPLITVIVVAYNARDTIERCLLSLRAQSFRQFEVIVVDSSSDDTAEIVREYFCEVRLARFATRRYPGDARNEGMRLARADLIAFLDSDCVAEPDWAGRILAAHRMQDPVVGGSVQNGCTYSQLSWAAYFCEFSRWAPEAPQGPVCDAPTCNLSLKRWIFDRCGPFLEGTYCSDTVFNWRVQRLGCRLRFEPGIRVSHLWTPTLALFLAKQRRHGRAFALVRVQERKLGRISVTGLCLGTPSLPLLLFFRLARRAVLNGIQLRRLAVCWPLVLLGLTAWSVGELQGYLDGLRRLTRPNRPKAAGT